MYTVVRFTSTKKDMVELISIGEAMNAIHPKTFDGLRKKDCSFVCDVCHDTEWSKHVQALGDFVTTFESVIKSAIRRDIFVTADIAVMPEDLEEGRRSRPIFSIFCTRSLVALLGAAGVELEVSIY